MADARTVVEGLAGVAAIGTTVLLSPLLRSWYSRWGVTDEEAHGAMPGDELAPQPKSEITCGITVHVPVEQVWPWLMQIGCQRAGWYSYDLLDNAGVPSADRVIPEYQHLEVGEKVLLRPDGSLGYPVRAIEPDKALILGGTLDTSTGDGVLPGDPTPEAYYSGINAFVLREGNGKDTRLIFRQRLDWSPGFANALMYRGFLEPISFVMARKTLKGIKQRAEGRSLIRR